MDSQKPSLATVPLRAARTECFSMLSSQYKSEITPSPPNSPKLSWAGWRSGLTLYFGHQWLCISEI